MLLVWITAGIATAVEPLGAPPQYDQGYIVPVASNEIKIMAYNVENLFNATHEGTHQDWEFLPKGHPVKSRCREITNDYYRIKCYSTDWTNEKVLLKIHQLVLALRAQGPLPDILALEEVESEEIVAYLQQGLGYAGYIFGRGPDERGINVAMLYSNRNLRLASRDYINVSMPGQRPTRNVLRAHFYMNTGNSSDILAVLANHWPSQGNPTAYREHIAKLLMQEVEAGVRHFGRDNYHVVMVGDFNSVFGEKPHPVNDYLLNRNWSLFLLDVHTLSDNSRNPMNGIMPRATQFYASERTWDRLDKILVSQNLYNGRGAEVIPETFRVVAPSYMTTIHKASGIPQIPLRYNFDATTPEEAGFSDHFPIVVKIKLQ